MAETETEWADRMVAELAKASPERINALKNALVMAFGDRRISEEFLGSFVKMEDGTVASRKKPQRLLKADKTKK